MRFLRLPQVSERTGFAPSTIRAYVAQGKFPKPVKIGARAVAWVSSEVEAWMEQRTETR